MQRWAHLVHKLGKDSLGDLQFKLDQFGNEGWELVAVVSDEEQGVVLYFKRPKS